MNFDGVEEAQGANYTLPGTIGIFTIKSAEAKTNTNGKEYIQITFENNEGKFSHMFYTSDAAAPRIQHLYKHANGGTALTGQVTTAQVIAGLQGKRVGLKVSGRVGNNGQTYADLGFGGFASDPNEEALKKLKFNAQEQRNIEAALTNQDNQGVKNADAEIAATDEENASAAKLNNF